MDYKNAAEILPSELVAEIQRYFPGGLLWVPKTGEHHKLRADLILKLLEKGEPVKDVAALAGYSKRGIRKLRERRKKKGRLESEGERN